MQWRIIAVGAPKLPYAKLGVEDYLQRLQRLTKVQALYLPTTAKSADLIQKSEGTLRIALDPRGELVTSEKLAHKVQSWQNHQAQDVSLLIGGADGHSDELRKQSHWNWSLSPLTLQHELALLVTLEQLYRAYSIINNLPYHRG